MSAKPANNPKIVTFDLDATVESEIKAGTIEFAVDQQQFLQGYLPIVILTNYAETRNLPTGDGRRFAADALTARDLPAPVRAGGPAGPPYSAARSGE